MWLDKGEVPHLVGCEVYCLCFPGQAFSFTRHVGGRETLSLPAPSYACTCSLTLGSTQTQHDL